MKRSLHERAKAFFINMGRKSRILKGPAILGLAFSMLLHRILSKRNETFYLCSVRIALLYGR